MSFDVACLYVVHEINYCCEPTMTCHVSSGGQQFSSMPASRATFVRYFFKEFSRLLHAGTVNEFGDLIFLRHHVSQEEPTDICVEEEIEPLGPYKRQKSLVLRVLDLMTFTRRLRSLRII